MMIMKKIAALISAATLLLFASCSDGGSDTAALTAVEITGNSSVSVGKTITLTAKATKTGSPSITYTWSIDPASTGSTLSATSGESVTLTAGSTTGSVKVSLSATDGTNTKTAEKTITVNTAPTISASDTPVGYASITPQTSNATTVTTKAELINAVKNGGLIYVSGTIDMSSGCLPSEAGGRTDELDAFVSTKTASLNSSDSSKYPNVYSTYAAFRDAYAGLCESTTDDGSSSSTATTLSQTLWKLNSEYGNTIKIIPVSNTTIIGLDGAVIKGGTFQISGVSNVTIRNLTIKDAYDPFPHHEKKDGFNAQWDAISIQNSASNIWIDHCTLEDTMKYKMVTIKSDANTTKTEKWQTYDGLCDITKSSNNVVVSYCIFKKHDKTMLIGSGSTDLSGGYITIHHNKFLNCGQRLPMTTYPNMHVYNNSFERDSDAYYEQQACIVGRYAAYTYVVENNYFGSGVKKCLTKSTDAAGSCYSSGNYFVESSVTTELVTSTGTKPFTPSYTYTLDTASEVASILESYAGAGVCNVAQ